MPLLKALAQHEGVLRTDGDDETGACEQAGSESGDPHQERARQQEDAQGAADGHLQAILFFFILYRKTEEAPAWTWYIRNCPHSQPCWKKVASRLRHAACRSARRHCRNGSGHWKTGSAKCCRSEEHTSELQSQSNLVCRLLLEKK